MVRKWLSLLLVTMIALQSVIAIADIHQFHQSGTTHLEFDHDHSTTPDQQSVLKNVSAAESASSTGDPLDCHHCCHCHGLTHFFLTPAQHTVDHIQHFQQAVESQLSDFSFQICPDLRPPKSVSHIT